MIRAVAGAALGLLLLIVASTSWLRKTRARAAEHERIRRMVDQARRAQALRLAIRAHRREK